MPPVGRSFSRLQPSDGCVEFHEIAQPFGIGPETSWWPNIAEPSEPPLVQLPQVMSGNGAPGNDVPSGRDPVSMSWLLGCWARPFTRLPFSSSAVCWLMLLFAE